MPIVLLSGPPASGKDTLSDLVAQIDPTFVHFRKVRDSAGGHGRHFDMVSPAAFDELVASGAFIQWHGRYGRRYGVLKEALFRLLDDGRIPIVHVGRLENRTAFLEHGLPCTTMLLTVPWTTAKRRLLARHDGDREEVARRLRAFREELAELGQGGATFDHVVCTAKKSAEAAAREMHRALRCWLETQCPGAE